MGEEREGGKEGVSRFLLPCSADELTTMSSTSLSVMV